MTDINALLLEKKEREEYADKVIDIIGYRWLFIDPKSHWTTAPISGTVWRYVADQLGVVCSPVFQRKLRQILKRRKLIKPRLTRGHTWLCGLKGNEEDNEKVKEVKKKTIKLTQNWRDRGLRFASLIDEDS